jgi:hypothetical protein
VGPGGALRPYWPEKSQNYEADRDSRQRGSAKELPGERQFFTGVTTNRDAGAPLVRRDYNGTSGEGRLALPISNEQFGSDFCSKRIVHVLEPDKLSLQVTYSLLKAAHLRDDAGIWPADVAE